MCANDTVNWMKEKDIYERWLLPAEGLHQDDPDLKYYFHRPCGNSPENMPWDTLLNNDVHKAVERQVVLTLELHKDCQRKFDMSTPGRGASAYLRVLEQVPCSQRIIKDVKNVLVSLEVVREAEGILVASLGKNYGRRYEKDPSLNSGLNSAGGKRVRKQAFDDYGDSNIWVHPDAEPCVALKREHALQREKGIQTKPLHKKMKV